MYFLQPEHRLMRLVPDRRTLTVLLPLAIWTVPWPAAAQEADNSAIVYDREVFAYNAGGRPDPFRSLLLDGDLGIRIEDLSLRGVVHHPDPSRSVAVLSQSGSSRRLQVREGERIGGMRILSIQPDRVEIVVEELGVSRRETLMLVRPEPGATP